MRDVIRGETQTVLRFLAHSALRLDDYQRDFVWTDEHVDQFARDLADRQRFWAAGDTARPWYLGTVMVHAREGDRYLVDGQQRTATLIALLLALRPRLKTDAARDDVDLAIGLDSRGGLRTPLADAHYRDVYRARFQDPRFVDERWAPGQARLAAAHRRLIIQLDAWPGETDWDELAYSVLHRTIVTVLVLRYAELVHEVFLGINTRGARLGPLDQLKNTLLLNLAPEERRTITQAWDLAARPIDPDSGSDARLSAIAAAAIAQYAPKDAFHKPRRWRSQKGRPVDYEPALNWIAREGVKSAVAERIARDLISFMRVHDGLAALTEAPDTGLEAAHFVESCGYGLDTWAPLLLAAVDPTGRPEGANTKRAAACLAFVDIAAARLAWNGHEDGPTGFRAALLGLVPEMRAAAPETVAKTLVAQLDLIAPKGFEPHSKLAVAPGAMRPTTARALLNRLTAHAEGEMPVSSYADLATTGAAGFVMHSISDAADGQRDQTDGALGPLADVVLVPTRLANAFANDQDDPSLGDARNTLAALAGGQTGLNGVSAHYPGLSSTDTEERAHAYADLAATIWSPTRISTAAVEPDIRLGAILSLQNGPLY